MTLAITRRQSRQVYVGHVAVGGGAPVMVQSMTNTDTEDVAGTVAQVAALARAGSEVVGVLVGAGAGANVSGSRNGISVTEPPAT